MANTSILAAFERMWQHVTAAIGSKSDLNHNHNDLYYTEAEVDNKISTHKHDDLYDAKGSASSALSSAKSYSDGNLATAKSYTDGKIDAIVGEGASTTLDTIGEISAAIEDNQDMLTTLNNAIGNKANANDLTSHTGNTSNPHGVTKSQVGLGNVENKSSSTIRSEITKSNVTTALGYTPLSQTDLDTHESSGHLSSDERLNWNKAYTHSISEHAPVNAQANQNAFSNVKVGSTTISADAIMDTIEFVGSNMTITPDATNDKITFSVATGTTSDAGIVQLTNSISSDSITTAATPNSVKTAYDLANTAKTNAATAQTKANEAYTLASGKVDSLSDLGITATSTELNYVDGVTSNVQTQLDAKAPAMGVAYIDENDNETVTLSVDLEELSSLVGGGV